MDPALKSTLSTLRAQVIEAIDSVQKLNDHVFFGGQPLMSSWPDLLSKYKLLASQMQNIQTTLSRGYVSLDSAGFTRHTTLRELVITPSKPIPAGELDNVLGAFLRMARPLPVLEEDSRVVGKIDTKLRLELLADDVIGARITALVDNHDIRVSSAVSIIEDIGRQYNWERREDDLEEDEEVVAQLLANDAALTSNGSTNRAGGDSDDDDMEMVAGNALSSNALGLDVDKALDSTPVVGHDEDDDMEMI